MPKNSSLRIGSCAKLAPQYCGPFEILERIGPMAYKISFSPSMKVHDVFHVSFLKMHVHDVGHVTDWFSFWGDQKESSNQSLNASYSIRSSCSKI